MLQDRTGEYDLAMARIVTLREASRLAGCSEDTLRRRHSSKIIRISPRRLGMRIRDALLNDDNTGA